LFAIDETFVCDTLEWINKYCRMSVRPFFFLRIAAMHKILLVDDEESIHLVYRQELEDEGYEVHSALTGEEALRKLKILSPDLVILDINMPGINGIEVLRRMKEINPKLPVILSTAYHEYKQDFGAWASDDYIVKSSDLDDLKAAVHRHLSQGMSTTD